MYHIKWPKLFSIKRCQTSNNQHGLNEISLKLSVFKIVYEILKFNVTECQRL